MLAYVFFLCSLKFNIYRLRLSGYTPNKRSFTFYFLHYALYYPYEIRGRIMSKRIQKVRDKWSDERLLGLPGVRFDSSPDAIFNLVLSADPTPNHKYLDWTLRAWETGKFLFEDIQTGNASRIADQLKRFEANKHKIPDPTMRSLMKYKGPGELDAAMDKAGVPKEISFFDMSSNQQKKAMMIKARLESRRGEMGGVTFDTLLSEFSSHILGRNTRWCTAASKDNMFEDYANNGPLIIIEIPGGQRFQSYVNITKILNPSSIRDWDNGGRVDLSYDEFIKNIMNINKFEIMNENDNALTAEDIKAIEPYRQSITEYLSKTYTDIYMYYIEGYDKYRASVEDAFHKCILSALSPREKHLFPVEQTPRNFNIFETITDKFMLEKTSDPDTFTFREGATVQDVHDIMEFLSSSPDMRNNTGKLLVPASLIEGLTGVLNHKYYVEASRSLIFGDGDKQCFLEAIDNLKAVNNKGYHIFVFIAEKLIDKLSFGDMLDLYNDASTPYYLRDLIEVSNHLLNKADTLNDYMEAMGARTLKEKYDIAVYKVLSLSNMKNSGQEKASGKYNEAKNIILEMRKEEFLQTNYDSSIDEETVRYIATRGLLDISIRLSKEDKKLLWGKTIELVMDKGHPMRQKALETLMTMIDRFPFEKDMGLDISADAVNMLYFMGAHVNGYDKPGSLVDGEFCMPSDDILSNDTGPLEHNRSISPYLGLMSLDKMELLERGIVTHEMIDGTLARLEGIRHIVETETEKANALYSEAYDNGYTTSRECVEENVNPQYMSMHWIDIIVSELKSEKERLVKKENAMVHSL